MKSYIPFLSFRYLRFHKVSSGLGILGVTLGVGMVIVVVGVMDGFQARLRRSLLGSTAAVVVRVDYDLDAGRLADALKAHVPGVLEASPVVRTWTLVSTENGRTGNGKPAQVFGVDAAREGAVNDLSSRLRYGQRQEGPLSLISSASPANPFETPREDQVKDRRLRKEKQGVLVGVVLLGRLGLRPGDRIRVWTLEETGSGEEGASRRDLKAQGELFRVTGVYNSGDSEVDSGVILMDRRDALSYFGAAFRQEADEIRLKIRDPEATEPIKAAIKDLSDRLVEASRRGPRTGAVPLEALSWQDLNWQILAAVENERGMLIVITSFSFLVVAFLIGSTQSMLVVEKTREIGVLRSLGGSVPGTAGVFLGNGLFIGTLGAVAGWALGSAVAYNVAAISRFIKEHLGRDLFPQNIYRFSEIPIDVKPEFVLKICVGAVFFALLGSLLPALRAASLDPVESLHHE